MTLLAYVLVIGLASYRAWRFLALDTITAQMRAWMFFRDPTNGQFRRYGRVAHYYWTCPWCLGAWITALFTLLTDLIVDGGVPAPLLVFAAASAITGIAGVNDPDQDFNTAA